MQGDNFFFKFKGQYCTKLLVHFFSERFSSATRHFNFNIGIHLLKIGSKYFGLKYKVLTTDLVFKGRQYTFDNVMKNIVMLITLNKNIFTVL